MPELTLLFTLSANFLLALVFQNTVFAQNILFFYPFPNLFIFLCSTSLGLSLPGLQMVEDLLMVNNGALAEQFVGQHLLYDGPSDEKQQLFYWNREQKSSNAEVDYLIAHEDKVVPVEVKAGATGALKSLQVFVAEKKSPVALRLYAMPPSCSRQETRVAGKERIPFLLV